MQYSIINNKKNFNNNITNNKEVLRKETTSNSKITNTILCLLKIITSITILNRWPTGYQGLNIMSTYSTTWQCRKCGAVVNTRQRNAGFRMVMEVLCSKAVLVQQEEIMSGMSWLKEDVRTISITMLNFKFHKYGIKIKRRPLKGLSRCKTKGRKHKK